MADMDQGVKRLLQAHPADIIQLALPGAEYLAPIETDVATEPQLVLDTLFRIRYHGVISKSIKCRHSCPQHGIVWA